VLTPPAIWFLFGLYAGFMFMMTHWPRLNIPLPGRPDLLVHASIFGVWTGLLLACGRFGPPLSGRNIGSTFLVGVGYAGVDEALQAIPFLKRTAAWDDWACDVTGVALACAVAFGISLTVGRAGAGRPTRS
jgi:VanZ family protein